MYGESICYCTIPGNQKHKMVKNMKQRIVKKITEKRGNPVSLFSFLTLPVKRERLKSARRVKGKGNKENEIRL